jgi:hypothetical protein
MSQVAALKAQLIGSGIAQDGEQGILTFTVAGRQLALALDVRQFDSLVRAAALWQSRARPRDEVPAIPLEKWSAAREQDSVILTLQAFDGLELRFRVSPETEKGGSGSD